MAAAAPREEADHGDAGADSDELARFGYKQELGRSLGRGAVINS